MTELESFNEKDGFSGGFAYKLLEDREGNIWLAVPKDWFNSATIKLFR